MVVANNLNCGPFDVNLREFDSLFLTECDAKLVHLDEAPDQVSHKGQVVLADLYLDVGSELFLLLKVLREQSLRSIE